MAIRGVQYSNKKIITTGETWTTEDFIEDVKIEDTLGSNSRVATILVSNANNIRGGVYSAYQRVRVIDDTSKTNIFLGRVEAIVPDHRKQNLTLICRDYLGDLSEKSTSATSYSDVRRSEIVKDIVNTDNDGIFGTGSAKGITTNFHVDDSNYLELITREYGDGSDGYESLLDSVDKLAHEEPWYPTATLFWTGTLAGFNNLWFVLTAEAWSSNELLLKPQFSHTGGAGGKSMRMYVGSTFQFSGMKFILQAVSNNTNLDVEYWDGTSWTNVASAPNTPTVTDTTSDLEQNGTITWSAIPSDWVTKTNLTGVESTDTIDSTLKDDANLTALTDASLTNLYWIRFMIDRDDSTATPSLIYHLSLLDSNGDPLDSSWDYRMEDPFFFDVVGDGNGAGDWNSHTTNSYSDSTSTNFNFLGNSGRHFYFGANRPFAGIEFELDTNGDYSGRTFTWEYYNGSTWTSLTDDNSYDFSSDGSTRFNTNTVTNWARADLIIDSIESSSEHNYLYYIRCSIDGLANTTAVIKTVRTVSIASLAFFERGTEPWPWRLEGTTDSHGGASTQLIDAAATFSSKLVGETVVNTSAGTSATVNAFVSSTELTLSSGIFSTGGGQTYEIDFSKKQSLNGTKANEVLGESWHGLTLVWRGTKDDQVIPIYRYQLGEQPIELYTRVIVHGRDGAKGTAVNSTRETTYGIIKEKVIYDYDLDTPGACSTKAESVLKTFQPGSSTAIRRGIIEVYDYPSYKRNNKPIPLRAGDVIQVTIADEQLSLTNERFLVWGIIYSCKATKAEILVTQDLIPSFEETSSTSTRLRETSKQLRNTSWKSSVPSGNSSKSVIFHNTVNVFSPEARIIQNNQADDNEDTLDIDEYTGGDDTNTVDYSATGNDNWSNAMKIYYSRGGALAFTGTDDTGQADLVSGNGRLYYNQDDDLFKVRVEKAEATTPTWHWLPVGEWGSIDVESDGTTTITFQNSYSSKPVILVTLDASDALTPPLNQTVEVESWVQDGSGNYTGVVIKTT